MLSPQLLDIRLQPPCSTPQAVEPYRIQDCSLWKVHDESLCRWNNLHRAHVRDFFNFSIRTTNRSLARHWQGIGWENAPPTLRNGLRSILPLIFFSAPRPMLVAPYLPNKKAPAEFQMCLLVAPSPSICSRFATERAHCFHDLFARFSHLYYACLPLDLESWDHGLPCSTSDSSIRQI